MQRMSRLLERRRQGSSQKTPPPSSTASTPEPDQQSPDGVDAAALRFFATPLAGVDHADNVVHGLSGSFSPPVFDASHGALEAERKRRELVEREAREHPQHPLHHAHPSQQQKGALPTRLPELSQVMGRRDEYVGPTRESNWVVLDHLMVGAYPSAFDDDENDQILASILTCGITTFVCLQSEYQHGVPESLWRSGVALRPYIEDAMDICARERTSGRIVPPEHLKFLHTGIVDCGVTTDATVLELALDICWRLVAGEVIYLHCWGGHGRTGTVVAVTLGLLYGVGAPEALSRTQLYHDLRICSLNVPSPQTPQQRRQVERILDGVARGIYGSVVPPIPIIRPSSPPPGLPSPRFVKPIKGRRSSLSSSEASFGASTPPVTSPQNAASSNGGVPKGFW